MHIFVEGKVIYSPKNMLNFKLWSWLHLWSLGNNVNNHEFPFPKDTSNEIAKL